MTFLDQKPFKSYLVIWQAFDILIGETDYLNQGIASQAITAIFEQHQNFTYLFADPNIDNVAAIRAYEKCDFRKIRAQISADEMLMIKEK